MKLLKKSIMLGLLAVTLCALFSVTAWAADESAISVQVNDQVLSFSDVPPAARSGRVYVPFRAVFEALGAQVNYDADTQTVTAARGDTTVSFVIGSQSVAVTDGSGTQTLDADAASFAENNRVLVPVRFAAQALGCVVGWDQQNQTVLILDSTAILGANDAQYTLLDKFIALSQSYQKDSYAVDGTYDCAMEFTDGDQVLPFTMDGTISGLYGDKVANLDMTMAMDLSELMSASGQELDQDSQAMLLLLKNIEIEYILNLPEGKIYMRSPLLSLSMGLQDSDAWLSMDLSELLDASGSFLSIYDAETFQDYIQALLVLFPLNDTDELTSTAQALQAINAYWSDACFIKVGSTYTNVLSFEQDGVRVDGKVVFKLKDGDLSSFSMSCTVNSDEMTGSISYIMDPVNQFNISLDFEMPDEMDLSMTYQLKYTKTTQVPLSAPEEGSTVIPMDSLYSTYITDE